MSYNAFYVSVWDAGTVTTPCNYNPGTGEVSEIVQVEVGDDHEILEDEYISFAGEEIRQFEIID